MSVSDRGYRAVIARLTRLYGVQPSFIDGSGTKITASTEALAAVLRGLGAPASTLSEAEDTERRRLVDISSRPVEPVTPVWQGRASFVDVLAERVAGGLLRLTVSLEGGGIIETDLDPAALRPVSRKSFEGVTREVVRVPLPRRLPAGYHRARIDSRGGPIETLLIVAPIKSFRHASERVAGAWGIFAPLYALRSERNAGCGDLTDLREFAEWSSAQGGRVVATLPLLSAFVGDRPGPFDPSPYNPVSRLFWNELFVDPTTLREFAQCPEAQRLVGSAGYKREAAACRDAEIVDYKRVATLKRRVLELLATSFFEHGGETLPAFIEFLKQSPLARDFAAFRATTEKQGRDWGAWPADLRKRRLTPKDYDAAAYAYHLYAQYATHTQLGELSSEVRSRGGLTYLDLPVGVSPFGFDTYRAPHLFAASCSTGAPPDPYFTGGQDWGFPPAHPEADRAEGYAYFIACLRSHMRFSDYLRLDHVMAFHRLFWIPTGMGAAHGVYVSYRAEELYAILSLESHRGRCRLVGENLGTVPPAVNKALAEHDLCGLYVGQYEMQPRKPALRPVPGNCVVSVNTHDMAPLATTWAARDVDDRIALGMLGADKRKGEKAVREEMKAALVDLLRKKKLVSGDRPTLAQVRDGLLQHLADSPADFLLVNAEDLWLETRWQNVPGTMTEHDNWRHKFKLTLPQIFADKSVAKILSAISALRDPVGAKPASGAAKAPTRTAAPATPAKKPTAKAASRGSSSKAAPKPNRTAKKAKPAPAKRRKAGASRR